jgi:hypothetical protein
MISDNIIYIDSLYADTSAIDALKFSTSITTDLSNITNDIKKEIQDSNAELKTPLYDGDYLLYFSENKDILLNDQTNFKNFKNIINSYISYIYYYIFFIIFIIFIILHYIYINTNNQIYSYFLITILVIYILYVAYSIYYKSIN